MDLNSISAIIKKINRLYTLIDDIGEASSTEKDLLKAYVLDLYEAVVIAPDEISAEKDEEEMLRLLKKKKKTEKKLKKQLEKNKAFLAEITEPDDEDESGAAGHEAATGGSTNDSSNGHGETVQAGKSEEQVTPPMPPELLELFEFGGVSELSDKLSLKPIHDLTRAMGINEKIFTINELFGGNKEEFENIIVALNGLSSFDEAREVLIHSVATKHEWQKANKYQKARNFIKLVQRRYN